MDDKNKVLRFIARNGWARVVELMQSNRKQRSARSQEIRTFCMKKNRCLLSQQSNAFEDGLFPVNTTSFNIGLSNRN